MKQSVVECLKDKLNQIKSSSTDMNGTIKFLETEFKELFEQAKEMENQQKGYSEEDMKDYALKCVETYLFNVDAISSNLRIPIMENNNKQFEQFKNKLEL